MTGTRGRLVAVDVGSVRIGLAVSDPGQVLASPLATVAVPPGTAAPDRVGEVVGEVVVAVEAAGVGAGEVAGWVVGLPVGLSGREGAAAEGARAFAARLAGLVPGEVRLVDERFTTTSAHRALAAAGRTSRQRRGVVDRAAAVVLLQHVLDTAAAQARPAVSA